MVRVARHYPAGRGEEISIRGESWPSVRFFAAVDTARTSASVRLPRYPSLFRTGR